MKTTKNDVSQLTGKQGNDHSKTSDNLLIVFAKTLEKGKVKTRLAKTIGDEKALQVYTSLLKITFDVIKNSSCDKVIFYSGFYVNTIPGNDDYVRVEQQGNDVGEKMNNAFDSAFISNYQKAIIIGSDCPGISAAIIEEAFHQLDQTDVVIGPAEDGGYYLIGMKKNHPDLFRNKNWSTSSVLAETLEDLKKRELTYSLLTLLSDLDDEHDLRKFPELNQ